MAPLSTEHPNAAFYKNFLTETLYLVQEEMPAPALPVAEQSVLAPVAESAPALPIAEAPVKPPVTPPAAPVPAIPKLPKVESVEVPKSFEVIGENRKGLVVLVTLPANEFQTLPQSEFLQRILAAIGFGPADVAFVNNVSGTITRFEALSEATLTRHIISFASRLDTDLPHEKFTLYNPVLLDDVPVVFSQSLAVLDGDQEQKKLLWNALQRVFKK
ncbi:hypothetical protein [Pontibacter roseus]|uniref:hypothetical protein n=1 Tax=Pontibacter roseus TaxID=336989 RepID=UPI0003723454|nr:hypothetical protein [Pontibacter roseus]